MKLLSFPLGRSGKPCPLVGYLYSMIRSVLQICTLLGMMYVASSCTGGSLVTVPTCELLFSRKLQEGIYLEGFKTCGGGVYAGDCYEYYVTDSSSFRSLVGQKDDHGLYTIYLEGDVVKAFLIDSRSVDDTTAVASIDVGDLLQRRPYDSSTEVGHPLLGPSRPLCKNRLPFGTEALGDGLILETDQFQCGERITNAVYITDSLHFRRLLGMYTDQNWDTRYRVERGGNQKLIVYEIAGRRVYDTLHTAAYRLAELRKDAFRPACR